MWGVGVPVSRAPVTPAGGSLTGVLEDHFKLDRFVQAQDSGGAYAQALAELREGHKRSHWIWFVFPQVVGLGSSPMSERYAISGLEEAAAYLAHPVLGPRLIECARVLAELPERDPVKVMGGIDALKLRSSMTLFARVGGADAGFSAVLSQYFGAVEDRETTRLLGA